MNSFTNQRCVFEANSPRQNHQPIKRPQLWAKLPYELRVMILEDIAFLEMADGRLEPIAACAAVSREWQRFFERVTFGSLELHQGDLDNLERYVSARPHRIAHLQWVHLRLVLSRYDCRRCGKPEHAVERRGNNLILAQALTKLFRIMAAWGGDHRTGRRWPLELELSAHSPSDWEHHFKSLRCHANYDQWGPRKAPRLDPADFDDADHGWVSCKRSRGATEGECLRVLGAGLEIEGWIPSGNDPPLAAPTVPIVRSFLIRRQFYRRFEAVGCLDRILEALPNLTTFRYERWRPIPLASGEDTRRQIDHYRELLHLISERPKITRVSIYEDCDDFNRMMRTPRGRALPPRPRDPYLGPLLASASRHWKKAYLSFMVDAADFFHEFWSETAAAAPLPPPPQWENLTDLYLTSDQLHPRRNMEGLLNAAARAAMAMPKLNRLALWTAKEGRACAFRYSITRFGERPGITLASTWHARLSPQTRRLWERVTGRRQSRYPLWVQYFDLRSDDMGSHGSGLPLLCSNSVAASSSQRQMISNALETTDLVRNLGTFVAGYEWVLYVDTRPAHRDDTGDDVFDAKFLLQTKKITSPCFQAT
ncbi:hypothetical protein PG993_002403 [Apiospora rasikravindrae]|uniref:DUF6546 domain-containing protein n=1 Tax=Apiospora rasikravindrae TaxID=990691 RepID=A0ABR1TZ79_9PEZI